MRRALFAMLLSLLLGGCGGGGSGPALISNATFQIVWPERTRALTHGLTSALSATVVFHNAAISGANVTVNVNRNSNLALHTETYDVSEPVRQSVTLMDATFYASPDQQGAVVGTATASVTVQQHSLELVTIQVVGTITAVTIIPPGVLDVGATPTQLAFSATDGSGAAVAVTPGSASWSVVSGGANLQVTPDGIATAVAEGTADIQTTVDGITSPSVTVTTHQPPTATIVQVPVNSLAYDPVATKIWATVPNVGPPYGNSVVGIDPATGTVGPIYSLGVEPNLIAVTDNGQFAYVTINADNTVRRVDLSSGTVPLIVSVGGQYVALIAVPGSPNSFVGAVDPIGGVNVSVWDDNVRRTGTGAGGNRIVFAGTPNLLYGQGGSSLFTNTLTANSINWVDQTNGLVDSSIDFSPGDGFLYTATGRILDTVAKIVVGQLPGTNFLVDKGVAVSDSDNRVYFVTWDPSTPKRILAFNKSTRAELPFFDTGVSPGGAQNLITCGPKSVAFSLFGSGVSRYVVIVRHLP